MANKRDDGIITKDDLKKLPRNEQRRYLDLGLVKGVAPTSETAASTASK